MLAVRQKLPVDGYSSNTKKYKENRMNKAQFVELVQKHGNYKTKVEADNAIKAFTEAVTEALVAKESVALVGFGTYEAALLKGKTGKVPGKDTTYTTEDKMVPKFKAGATLKSAVAAGK